MKFLLTGACGFIGSNIALNLLKEGHQILNLDKLTYAANTAGFESFPVSHYKLIHIDTSKLLDSPSVISEIKDFNPDYIIHLAAESMVDRSLENNRVFFESNVLGTWAILELIKLLNIKKAVFFSTDEVYGSLSSTAGLEHYKTDDFLYGVHESAKLDPRNPYAGSKAAADQLTLSYVHNFELPVSMVRPTNNYGPRQDKEKLIPKAICNILCGKRIPIFGNGKFYREWIYVEDTYNAVMKVLENGRPGVVYNIGSGRRCSNIELIQLLCTLLNVDFNEVVEYVTDRKGHDIAYSVNSKLIREYGWHPNTALEDGLLLTIDYYKSLRI